MSLLESSMRITRRAAVGALGAAGLGFALFGPRGSKEQSGGRLVLDYWEKWTGHEGAAMQRVVDGFNASQDRLFVRYFVTSQIGQKALIAIAGGDPPDIIGLWNFNVPPYAESNALLPLDELVPSLGVRLEDYAPGVRQVMTHRGRFWAVVSTAGTLAMYYNRALLSAAGLDPGRPPRTVAELDAAHQGLVRADASGELDRVGFLHTEPGWWSWIWGYHFGGSIYDEASDRSTIASAENVAAYGWMQSYPAALGVDRVERFRAGLGSYNTPQNGFLTGKVAMEVQGPWLANMVAAFRPDLDYGVAPIPVDERVYDAAAPVALIDTDVLVIPRGARHPKESMEFIAYTQRREVCEALAKAHCKGSPLLDVSEDFLASHPNRGVRLHTELARSPRAFVAPRTRTWQQLKDETDATVQRIWRLEKPAPALLGELQARSQTIVDHAADQRARRKGRAEGPAGGAAGGGA